MTEAAAVSSDGASGSCLIELPPLLAWTFFGPLLVGYLPFLITTTAPEIMHIGSTVGSGMLVGTVLETIIPEAYMLLHAQHFEQHNHDEGHDDHEHHKQYHPHTTPHSHGYSSNATDAAQYAGLATSLGFLFMLICDRISQWHSNGSSHSHCHSHSHSRSHSHSQSSQSPKKRAVDIEMEVGNFSRKASGGHVDSRRDVQISPEEKQLQSLEGKIRAKAEATTTRISFGLVLHAAMDGIPLGAAACSGNGSLETVMMLAILLHKAPASFGLTSFLLGSGAPQKSVLRSLILFCLAAPITALCAVLLLIAGGSEEHAATPAFTGLGLLFSAGTMIYTVTTHILPSVSENVDESQLVIQTVTFVFGLMVPFAIEIAHGGHAH
eukprot:CAMPEP_0114521080 /NCGR_PEP_ID=MMETSP0109-20121206/19984_1 /TAXON_ID=29199 /ORGANISM="Chlorarachnion reptans, Strain CCCM449" /LENGTH=379 /DNA_ID=CAMNT_0001702139 /DNA_START=188 /DNA_END=1327 /DNA_ORIENTATION=-